MLVTLYRDMISLITILLGLVNRYEAILYKFLALVEVTGLGVLLDVLMYKR
jgi:hypothetical protein